MVTMCLVGMSDTGPLRTLVSPNPTLCGFTFPTTDLRELAVVVHEGTDPTQVCIRVHGRRKHEGDDDQHCINFNLLRSSCLS